MQPLSPPPVITFGLALFVPRLEEYKLQSLTVQCKVFWKETIEVVSNCSPAPRPIFQAIGTMTSEPLTFLFNTDSPLPAGRYDISLVAQGAASLRGFKSFVLPRSKPNLIIGFPYSVYAPVTLS